MRCVVCDSTMFNDTMKELGIDRPIEYWIENSDTGEQLCNRCHEEIEGTILDDITKDLEGLETDNVDETDT